MVNMGQLSKILVIIPTYNEKSNIAFLLKELYSLAIELSVLIIDDNSPDGTSRAVSEAQDKYPNLYLITRKLKMGLGSAYKEGFRYALDKGYDVIVQMDADLSHRPAYIPKMLDMLDNNDLVIGSRYVKGGGVSGWPLLRIWLSKCANIFSKKILRLPINDLTSGFKCLKRTILENVDFDKITAKGYAFQIEEVYKALLNKFRAREYPIIFYEREQAKSKMSLRIIIEAFLRVVSLAAG